MQPALRVLALLGASAALAFGQADANKAQLSGTVTDPNQAVMPNVTVKIRNAGTGLSREAKTNDAGQYRAVLLDPGVYTVEAEATGFAKASFSNVALSVGQSVTLDIPLSLQQTSVTVEVGETLLSVDASAASTNVGGQAITNLPINGRRFQDFATLTPTAQVDTATRGQISFAGQRGIYSNIMLDGADYNQPFFGGIRGGERSGTVITVPQAAIQEFQVVATGYTAEYGRSTGGVMNTITKSGTNVLHGEAFYQNRDRALAANSIVPVLPPGQTQQIFANPTPSLQQYGGGIGGPIKKDRLFFFVAAEGQKSSATRRTVFAPIAGVAETAENRAGLTYLRSLEQPFDSTNRAWALTTKGDYAFANGDRLTLRYNYSDSKENNAATVGGTVAPFANFAVSNEGSELDTIHNGTLQYTKLLTPAVVNDLRFTGSAEVRPRLANSTAPQVALGIIGTYGARGFLPTTQSDKRWQFSDALSATVGRHTLKFGADLNFLSASQFFAFNQFGSFSFPTISADVNALLRTLSATGTGGVNKFDLPGVQYVRAIGNGLASFDSRQLAFFAQDSWKVRNNLTFDLGFRWEGQRNPAVEANNTALVNRVQGRVFPIGSVANVTSIPNSMKQLMPRFGFAYTPINGERKLVLRGFTGIFYGATPLLSFAGPNNNFRLPPGDVSLQVGNLAGQPSIYQSFLAAGVDLNRFTPDNLPVLTVDQLTRAATFAAGGTARDPFANANLLAMAADFRNPRSVQAGLGVESEILPGFTTGVQFNYVNTVNLLRNRNYNLPAPTINAVGRPVFNLAQRPDPGLGTLTVRESSARGMYRAATLSAQYRKRKFQFQAFYTVSENFSNDDNERDAGGFVYENSFNLIPEYAYANMDIRGQFTSNALYQLPWGFEVSGIYRVRSGIPFNAIVGSDAIASGGNGDGSNTDRPYLSPGRPMARNSFRNRGITTTDIRVMKNFKLGERMRVQLSSEIFNLFNADNVVFAGATNVFGAGINPTTGAAVTPNVNFMRLKQADGTYDRNNTQITNPIQAQFGIRFFF